MRGSKQGIFCSGPSLHLGGSLQTTAQKGGIQSPEDLLIWEYRVWSSEMPRLLQSVGRERTLENLFTGTQRTPIFVCIGWNSQGHAKNKFWKKNNYSGAKAKQLPEISKGQDFSDFQQQEWRYIFEFNVYSAEIPGASHQSSEV